MKTLNNWLKWQIKQYPSTIDLGLTRVKTVWQRLHPQPLKTKVIMVGGTNGKGSSVAILSQIFKQAHIRFAAYTSPELLKYNERFNINGQNASDQAICSAFSAIKTACQNDIKLTTFEYSTLAALKLFSDQPLDVIILEVGLGGRLDAVNIIDADIAIITGIELDHQDWLGDTREAIGYEKAGIFRPHQWAIYAGQDLPQSILETAQNLKTDLSVQGQDYQIKIEADQWHLSGKNLPDWYQNITMPHLRGTHQINNAAGVLLALIPLLDSFKIDLKIINAALNQVQLKGRLQIIKGDIPIILDVAHNPQSVAALLEYLKKQPIQGQTLAIFSMLADKDIKGVITHIKPYINEWFVAPLDVERGLSALQLKDIMPQASHFKDISRAFIAAKAVAKKGDQILVFGSFYTVAQVLKKIN